MRWGLGMLLHTQREGDYVGLTQLPGLVQQLTLSSKRVPDGNAFNRGVSDLNYRCHRAQTWKTWKSSSNEASCVRRFDLFTGNSTQEALAPFPGTQELKKRSHHFPAGRLGNAHRVNCRVNDLSYRYHRAQIWVFQSCYKYNPVKTPTLSLPLCNIRQRPRPPAKAPHPHRHARHVSARLLGECQVHGVDKNQTLSLPLGNTRQRPRHVAAR